MYLCMCVHAHIYTYKCIYVQIHIYNCMYIYVHTYKHICIFICVFIHTHIHIHYTLIHRPSCSNFILKVNVNINETDVGKIPAGVAESFYQRNIVSSLSFFFFVPSHHLSIPVLSPYLRLPGRPPSIFPLQSPAPLSFIRFLHGGREPLHKPVGSLVILRLPRRTRSDAQSQVHKGAHACRHTRAASGAPFELLTFKSLGFCFQRCICSTNTAHSFSFLVMKHIKAYGISPLH